MRRWPIIRHFRWLYNWILVQRHYEVWRSMGYFPVHADRDYEVLRDIWRGLA